MKNWQISHMSHCNSIIHLQFNLISTDCHWVWFMAVAHTCRLHTNAVDGLIAESSPPLSFSIYVHTRPVPCWFTFSPVSEVQVPAIGISKISLSLKSKVDGLLNWTIHLDKAFKVVVLQYYTSLWNAKKLFYYTLGLDFLLLNIILWILEGWSLVLYLLFVQSNPQRCLKIHN